MLEFSDNRADRYTSLLTAAYLGKHMNTFSGYIQCSKIPVLVSSKDGTLLVHQGTILTMDLGFDIPDGIWALNLEKEGLTSHQSTS